jgi:CRP-like cAMP-binding protein
MDESLKKLELWCSTFESKTFEQGELIMRLSEGPQYLYFLQSGFARLYTNTKDGREVTLLISKPGSMLGLSFMVSKWKLSDNYVIEALSPVKVFMVPSHAFLAYCQKNADISWFFVSKFSDALSGVLLRLEQSLLEKPQELIGVISYLASQFGKKHGESDEIIIPFPLTSEQLATWTGTARETVARTVSTLKKQGLLRTERKKMVIRNLAVLKAFNA